MTDQVAAESITPLRNNDVLFGRGKGPHNHPGNVAFRALVESRKAEYWSEDQAYGEKAQLAGEVYDAIATPAASNGRLGGRFLKQADNKDEVMDEIRAGRSVSIYKGNYFVEVPRKLAVAKCKMALRQKGNAADQREARQRKRPSLQEDATTFSNSGAGTSLGSSQHAASASSSINIGTSPVRNEHMSSAMLDDASSFPAAAAAVAAAPPPPLDLDSWRLESDLHPPTYGRSQQQQYPENGNDVLMAAAMEAAQGVAIRDMAESNAHVDTRGLVDVGAHGDGASGEDSTYEPIPLEQIHNPDASVGSTRNRQNVTSLIVTALASIQTYRSNLEATSGFDANSLGRILYNIFAEAHEAARTSSTKPNEEIPDTDQNDEGQGSAEPAKRERRNTGSYQSLATLGYPVPLSNLVGCLLNQTASEAFYSSSTEVESDMQQLILRQGDDGTAAEVEGQADGHLYFDNSRIFGRDDELRVLLSAYDRVVREKDESRSFVTISGYSGTGKTSLVNQLGRRLLADKASLVRCSFPAQGQSMSALFQAFDEYCRHLSEVGRDDRDWLDGIRRDVGEALGDRSDILLGCLPSLRSLLGENTDSPTARAETKEEEMNRILFYFAKFVKAISAPEHPVIIVLDDIQWCDESCLEIVRTLLRDAEITSVLFVGCYRDEEVGSDHRFSDLFGELAMEESLPMTSIPLANLDPDGVNAFISSVLRLNPRYTRPLADVLQRKTQGNPLFVRQLLRSLADDGLLLFSATSRRWTWDHEAITTKPIASNAVSLTIDMMRRSYDQGVQNALRISALLGVSFKKEILERLFLLYECGSKSDFDLCIESAVAGGIIVQDCCGLLRFSHDQLYQAACALTPSEEQALAHLDIGRRLLRSAKGEDINGRGSDFVTTTVDQYNEGVSLITDHAEKLRLAELNLIAGEAALNSASFLSAAIYLLRGCGLIGTDDWKSHYDVCLRLFTFCSEAQLTQGMAEGAVTSATEVLKNGKSVHDKLPAHQALLTAYIILGNHSDAIVHGMSVLKEFGEDFPTDADEQQAASRTELMRICAVLESKSFDDIVGQTSVECDSSEILSMQLLMAVSRIAYNNDPTLMLLLVFRMVSKSMTLGLTAEASFAFAALAFALCGLGKYELSSFCARVALALLQKFSQKYFHIVQLLLNSSILLCTQPQQACAEQLYAAYEDAMSVGAVEWAMINLSRNLYASLFAPDPNSTLEDYLKRIVRAFEANLSNKHELNALYIEFLCRLIRNLTNKDESSDPLSSLACDEQIITKFTPQSQVHIMRKSLAFRVWFGRLFGEYDGMKELIEELQSMVARNPFTPPMDTHNDYFYIGLVAFAMLRKDDSDKEYWDNITLDVMKKFEAWIEIGNEWNFNSKMQLLLAERAYYENDIDVAETAYDEAIAKARQTGFIHEEALACELGGSFYCERGAISEGRSYLQDSVALYTRWGAHRKAIHVRSVLRNYHC